MKNRYKRLISSFAFVVCGLSTAFAQEASMETLSLNNMNSFQSQDGNWMIVGDVSMDPMVTVEGKTRRRNKRKAEPVKYEAGDGILLNLNTEEKRSPLITDWEHGDLDLELEVMLPKGSNSGIYLQGRYEVQLLDSWGAGDPSYSDMGGIYRNWEQEPEKFFPGKAPVSNAAKAPGLWQTLKISFRAPRFNDAGEKIENARFRFVELNGVRIHDNVQVPLPTGGPIENNEQPKGPLMIQGDHGPVALRNIKYRLLEDLDVRLEGDISYDVFYGEFENGNDFSSVEPDQQGTTSNLSWQLVEKDTVFGANYSGTIHIPEDDSYTFNLTANSGAVLSIGGQTVVASQGGEESGSVSLRSGNHPFELQYSRRRGYREPRLGLTVSAEGKNEKELHSYDSFPTNFNVIPPIHVEVGSRPRMLRAFLDFEGDHSQRLTHTIAVGDPDGIHYIYDLDGANVPVVWRGGEFIDATSMWYSRGDGSFEPQGLKQYLFSGNSLGVLENERAPFPEEEIYSNRRYEVDENSGLPTFKYTYGDVEISDKIYPDEDNKMLLREVAIENGNDNSDLFVKLAEGDAIVPNSDGTYVIGDDYYIQVLSSEKPVVREIDGRQELILPLDSTPIKYSIIW